MIYPTYTENLSIERFFCSIIIRDITSYITLLLWKKIFNRHNIQMRIQIFSRTNEYYKDRIFKIEYIILYSEFLKKTETFLNLNWEKGDFRKTPDTRLWQTSKTDCSNFDRRFLFLHWDKNFLAFLWNLTFNMD